MTNTLYFDSIKFPRLEEMHFWVLKNPAGTVIASEHNSTSTREETIVNCVEVFGSQLLNPKFVKIFDPSVRDELIKEYRRIFNKEQS
ncbi:gp084 [Rhodococcus phage ReqiPoco6]|uniref:Gp084 n=1 Tax=Rhodococcus phage ReqiPoco6 TaxID=691964 RepID=D4P7V2_9CAUD|nr:gp084 [Rhodococcus phage ReqiPoco6]ADD81082.1 gp084 [Rhodococcus phage ReqiPoco6]